LPHFYKICHGVEVNKIILTSVILRDHRTK
jgi:hypothetical protein